MKKQFIVAALVLAAVDAGAASIHPADEYDIKSAAQFEVMKDHVKAGTPKQVGKGYEVPVDVNGLKCTVMVMQYTPSSIEPPIRWKANQPVCKQ